MKMLLLFVMLFTDVYQIFVNRNRPCCKKVQASEKNFHLLQARSKKFVDCETNNQCQLCNYS